MRWLLTARCFARVAMVERTAEMLLKIKRWDDNLRHCDDTSYLKSTRLFEVRSGYLVFVGTAVTRVDFHPVPPAFEVIVNRWREIL